MPHIGPGPMPASSITRSPCRGPMLIECASRAAAGEPMRIWFPLDLAQARAGRVRRRMRSGRATSRSCPLPESAPRARPVPAAPPLPLGSSRWTRRTARSCRCWTNWRAWLPHAGPARFGWPGSRTGGASLPLLQRRRPRPPRGRRDLCVPEPACRRPRRVAGPGATPATRPQLARGGLAGTGAPPAGRGAGLLQRPRAFLGAALPDSRRCTTSTSRSRS